MADGRITIDTRIDTSGIDRGINDVNNRLNRMGSVNFGGLRDAFAGATQDASIFGMSLGDIGSAMSSSSGMAGMLGGAVSALASAFIDLAMQGIQMAIQAMGEFAKKGIELASNIGESMNVINVTFGEENGIVSWANESASSFNIATDEALKFAGTFGTITKQMTKDSAVIEDMSKLLTSLSGDMASFYNSSNEEAFNALRAGLTGEAEQLKKFNVFMSQAALDQYALAQGMEKTVQQMSEQEKMLLRLNFILSKTKDVQGDAIRTQDGYANATKQLELSMNNASVAFGDKLLPSLTSLKQGVAEFVEDNKPLVELLGSVGGALLGVLNVASKLANSIVLKPLIDGLNTLASLIEPLFDMINKGAEDFKKLFNVLDLSAKDTNKNLEVYTKDFSNVAIDSMGEVADATEEAFKKTREIIEGELGVVKGALEKYYEEDLKEYSEYLDKTLGNGKASQIKHAQMMEDRKQRNDRMLQKDLENEEKKLTYAQKQIELQREAQKIQEDGLKKQSDIMKQETEKQKGFIDSLKSSWDKFFSSTGSKTVSFGTGYNTVNRSVSAYSNSRSTSNTFNMNLYGTDFITALDQAQMIARLRG